MKVDVTECIVELLHKNGVASIPGIGTFSVVDVAADIRNSKIYPPYRSIRFDEKIPQTKELVDSIRNKYKLNKSTSESVVKKYSQLVMNKLVNFNKVSLANLGTLKSSKKGITFLENNNVINASKSILPVYEMPALLVKKTTEAPVNTLAAEKKPNESKIVIPEKTQTTFTSPYSSPPKKEAGLLSYLLPILLLGLLALAVILGLRKCTSYVNQNIDGTSIVDGDDDNANNLNSDANGNNANNEFVYDSNKEYSLEEAKRFPNSVFENGCIIIVGSFKKNRNALNMESKIQSLGYKSHKSFNANGLTRVGINFECHLDNLESFIAKVRNDVEPTSWYLMPNVKIEY